MSIPSDKELEDIRRVFETLLHQDWTIEGHTLEEVFENNYRLNGIRDGVRKGAQLLIDSEFTKQHLDEILFGIWGAGYEPEAEEFEDWRDALREIVGLCDKYNEMEK